MPTPPGRDQTIAIVVDPADDPLPVCGSDDVLAVLPGDEGEGCDLFLLRREVPLRAWCSAHWPHVPEAEQAEARR